MKLEEYIGQYIDKGKSLGYQSTDLVSQYVEDLTGGEYTTYMDARLTHQERLPSNWEIIKVRLHTEFQKGDIFVKTDFIFGFNGIVYSQLDNTNLIVITQNYNGTNGRMYKGYKDLPVFQHTLSIKNIEYIIRPDKETLKQKLEDNIYQKDTNFMSTSWKKEFLGRYYKNESAILNCKYKTAEGYVSTSKDSEKTHNILEGAKVLYDRVYLDNGFVWVRVPVLEDNNIFLPIRTWNGVNPKDPDYFVGTLEGYVIETTNSKFKTKKSKKIENKHGNGWDIYIDKHKNIMFVVVNTDVTRDVKDKVKEKLTVLDDYRIVIVDNINSIQYI